MKHVEFELRNRWAIECKRLRSTKQALRRLRGAKSQLEERGKLGAVCLSLDVVVPPENGVFWEAAGVEDLEERICAVARPFLRRLAADFVREIRCDAVRCVVATFSVLALYHEGESVSLPVFRVAIDGQGELVCSHVLAKVVNELST